MACFCEMFLLEWERGSKCLAINWDKCAICNCAFRIFFTFCPFWVAFFSPPAIKEPQNFISLSSFSSSVCWHLLTFNKLSKVCGSRRKGSLLFSYHLKFAFSCYFGLPGLPKLSLFCCKYGRIIGRHVFYSTFYSFCFGNLISEPENKTAESNNSHW